MSALEKLQLRREALRRELVIIGDRLAALQAEAKAAGAALAEIEFAIDLVRDAEPVPAAAAEKKERRPPRRIADLVRDALVPGTWSSAPEILERINQGRPKPERIAARAVAKALASGRINGLKSSSTGSRPLFSRDEEPQAELPVADRDEAAA